MKVNLKSNDGSSHGELALNDRLDSQYDKKEVKEEVELVQDEKVALKMTTASVVTET